MKQRQGKTHTTDDVHIDEIFKNIEYIDLSTYNSMPPPFNEPPVVPQGVVIDAVVWVVIFCHTEEVVAVAVVMHRPEMQLQKPLARATLRRGVPWQVLP